MVAKENENISQKTHVIITSNKTGVPNRKVKENIVQIKQFNNNGWKTEMETKM